MKDQLLQLIAEGKIEAVIKTLLQIPESSIDHYLREEIVHQSNTLEGIAREKRKGLLSNEEYRVGMARLSNAVITIVRKLPDELQAEDLRKNSKKKRMPWWRWVTSAGVIIGILAGVAVFKRVSLTDLFASKKPTSFSVTVIVHGKEGKDDRILRNQGKVVLDVGGTREEEAIGDQGEVTFKGLSRNYIGQQALISIDHPQPYKPIERDQEFILQEEDRIYLAVELQGMDKVFGRVLDFETEEPLDSVRVSYQNIPTYTDEFGWYELPIPEERRTKFIKLNFQKAGYQMVEEDSIAPHTQQEFSLSLKRK